MAVLLWSSGLYSIKCLCSSWWPIFLTNLSVVLHRQGNLELYCPVGSYMCPDNHTPDNTVSLARRSLNKSSLLLNTKKSHTPVMSIPTTRFTKSPTYTYIHTYIHTYIWKPNCKLCKNLKLTRFAEDTLSYTRNVRGSSSWKLTSDGEKLRLTLLMSFPKFSVTKITLFWGSVNTHWKKRRNYFHTITLRKKIHTLSIRPQIYINLHPQTQNYS